MIIIGLLYLTFEKSLLSQTRLKGDSTKPADDALSRALVGVQVCKDTCYLS